MAAFDELQEGAGQDKFLQLYQKYDATMTELKSGVQGQVLTGNGAGSAPSMQFPFITFVQIDIGDWNMDANSSVVVILPSPLLTRSKIRFISVMIRPDVDPTYDRLIPLYSVQNAILGDYGGGSPEPDGGIDFVSVEGGGVLYISRKTSGNFDNARFDSTSYNRGYVTIGYVQ